MGSKHDVSIQAGIDLADKHRTEIGELDEIALAAYAKRQAEMAPEHEGTTTNLLKEWWNYARNILEESLTAAKQKALARFFSSHQNVR